MENLKTIKHIELGGGYTMRRKVILDIEKINDEYEVMAMLPDGEELDSGKFDDREDALAEFDKYFNKYAEDFQKAIYNANLKPYERYTIACLSDFGFPCVIHIEYLDADYTTYAQHSDVVRLKYHQKYKKHDTEKYFYNKSVSIFKGWQELPKDFGYNVIGESDQVVTKMSKYGCFDYHYIEDMNNYFKNPVLIYDGSKIGVNGTRYA